MSFDQTFLTILIENSGEIYVEVILKFKFVTTNCRDNWIIEIEDFKITNNKNIKFYSRK